jgi:hypothetical protein
VLFSTIGIAPFLGDEISTGLEVKSLGDLRQVVQSGQMDALKIFVNQDFGPAQKRREITRIQRRIGQEPVQMTGELAVPFGYPGRGSLTLPSHDEPPRRSLEDNFSGAARDSQTALRDVP